ncbi:hypothetical protein FEDK69T_10730 [Flavobacterium enshiense DK69]|nr:hypothetical protein FEDK69T_10730 [Flavobacterium enshiense DK69]
MGFFILFNFNIISDICTVMNKHWTGLLAHLKFLIKRNPE